MGVKHTVVLSRHYAEQKYADLLAEQRRIFDLAAAKTMSNLQLEQALERMNDASRDVEGFENYTIEGGRK